MFEMLGNQLFLVRNYLRAAEMLEKALRKDPANKHLKRKLIICYTQTGDVKKAFDHFLWLIERDIHFIIDIDALADDCPCSELVCDLEPQSEQNRDSVDFQIISGILWLYCDADKSLRYFLRARELDPSNPHIKSVIAHIQNYVINTHSN